MVAYWDNGEAYCEGCAGEAIKRPENLGNGTGRCHGCGERFPDSFHRGYVRTPDGAYLVQMPADNRFGFVLADDDQAWDFPPVNSWEAVPESEVPDEVRDRLGWILEEV